MALEKVTNVADTENDSGAGSIELPTDSKCPRARALFVSVSITK